MRGTTITMSAAGTLALLAAVMGAKTGVGQTAGGAPEFDLTWHTIDGGGIMRSTGGDFELSGTIGQHDAGRMAGGDFELTGGFWFEVLPSDCNEDGVISLLDYDTFETCLTGPGGGPLPGGCNCFDFDQDGVVTLADFATMQELFNGL